VFHPTLSHLMLGGYKLNLEATQVLLVALKANKTVTKLTLEDCSMTKAPFELWTGFLQSRDSLFHDLHIRPASLIDPLHARPPDVSEHWDQEASWKVPLDGNVLDSSVIGDWLPTMLRHSSVRDLTLDVDIDHEVPFYAAMFDELARNPSGVQLQYLTIKALDAPIANALFDFLVQTTHLRTFEIETEFESEIAWFLLGALRQNGSIDLVIWKLNESDERVEESLTASNAASYRAWSYWVETFYTRNEVAPMLLALSDVDIADEPMEEINPCLVPSLFAVVQKAPRTAPNNMLIGLLVALGCERVRSPAQGMCIGKRLRDN
jgi:hypothetical protein